MPLQAPEQSIEVEVLFPKSSERIGKHSRGALCLESRHIYPKESNHRLEYEEVGEELQTSRYEEQTLLIS